MFLTNKKSSYLKIGSFLISLPSMPLMATRLHIQYTRIILKKNGISVSNVLYADVGVGEAYASILICFAILIARFI